MEFQGFSPQTFDFLWGIRFNNNREWFLAHKQDYQTTLYEPMKALGAAIFAPFSEVPGLGYRVSRIYKDVRFSKGGPYKDHLWICIRQDADSWSQAPTLFFELRPEEYSYGLVYWRPQAAVMQRFRAELSERADLLPLLQQVEAASGCRIGGETYARPKPAPSEALARFYALKNICAYVTLPPDESLFSPALAGTVRSTLQALLPLHSYFQSLATQIAE